ncbi:hypothetical protein RhiJN_03370 [Ceratobasidium sp. AG-Ba]|nr:hypothetical protein RhiJN_03370 [Ceratobasidium sp. AG-Ba]
MVTPIPNCRAARPDATHSVNPPYFDVKSTFLSPVFMIFGMGKQSNKTNQGAYEPSDTSSRATRKAPTLGNSAATMTKVI